MFNNAPVMTKIARFRAAKVPSFCVPSDHRKCLGASAHAHSRIDISIQASAVSSEIEDTNVAFPNRRLNRDDIEEE
jgi:hypothetical protein